MNLFQNKTKQIQTIAIALLLSVLCTNSVAQTDQQTTSFIKYKNYLIPISVFGSPSNVNVVTVPQSVGGNVYQITWPAVSGATYYQINIIDENGDVTSITTTDLEYSLSNLPLGTSDVELLACNDQNVCGSAAEVGTYTINERVRYAVADILGSPILEADQAGNVVAEFHYKPFGETQEEQREDIGYTGHLEDTDLSLTYMQARYYDPVLGRFMSNDPVDFLGHLGRGNNAASGFNRYAYANNNPYKYVDPDGEFGQFFLGAAIGIVAEVATQIVTTGSVNNIGEVVKQGAIGFVSGGTGGAAGKLVGKALSTITTPKAGLANGASKLVLEAASGASSGSVTGATSSALNQLSETGSIDPNQIKTDSLKGALFGSVAGAASGKIQADSSLKILGGARRNLMFLKEGSPGASAGNIVGNSIGAATSIIDSTLSACDGQGGDTDGC